MASFSDWRTDFLVKKKDGSLHLVMDYQGLNKVIIHNRYFNSLDSQSLNSTVVDPIFSKDCFVCCK